MIFLKYPSIKGINFGESKYQNKKTDYDGYEYDSRKEANYAMDLDLEMSARGKNKVIKWEKQVKYPITVNGQHICNYILDFRVHRASGVIEYIDVKGYKKGGAYSLFKIKKKLVEALYNIVIKEV